MLGRVEERDLFDLLDVLDETAAHYWLDGGWGVDCLLGAQSRAHGDLDVVLARSDVPRVLSLLAARGFVVIRDWLPTSVALRDGQGREVDLHPVDLTADGGGEQTLPDGATWHYSPPTVGSIDGRSIGCASAEDQLLMHQGYEPRPVDFHDVRNIAARFGLPTPAPYDAPPEGT